MNSSGLVSKTFCLAILAFAGSIFSGCMKAPDPSLVDGGEQSAPSTSPAEPRTPHVHFKAPADWTETQPQHSFYLNTWALPGEGVANISFLGSNTKIIGDNLERWIGQWTSNSGSPVEDVNEYVLENAGMETMMLVLEGTLAQTAQLGGGPARENWILIGAVVVTEMGPLYVKAMGPISTLKAQLGELEETLRTLVVD